MVDIKCLHQSSQQAQKIIVSRHKKLLTMIQKILNVQPRDTTMLLYIITIKLHSKLVMIWWGSRKIDWNRFYGNLQAADWLQLAISTSMTVAIDQNVNLMVFWHFKVQFNRPWNQQIKTGRPRTRALRTTKEFFENFSKKFSNSKSTQKDAYKSHMHTE